MNKYDGLTTLLIDDTIMSYFTENIGTETTSIHLIEELSDLLGSIFIMKIDLEYVSMNNILTISYIDIDGSKIELSKKIKYINILE